jgi:hypothetical protein
MMLEQRVSASAAVLFALAVVTAPAVAVAAPGPASEPAGRGVLNAADWRQVRDLIASTQSTAQPVPAFTYDAYLKASNTGAGDNFGYSVAVSGDTIVVGAPFEASNATGVDGNSANNSATEAGAAYVFTRTAGSWSQQAYLKASNTGAYDRFGYSVAIAGDTIVVGADGEDSGATGVNGDATDNSTVRAGAAYVFIRSAGSWSQQAYLKASNTAAEDNFGHSVAISGDTIVVGAPWEDSSATGINGNPADNSATDAGAAYAFTRSAGSWSQQAYLKASNTGIVDLFGWAVAISGETIGVGAPFENSSSTGVNGNESDNSADNAGAAYVFTRSAGTWSQQAYLKASNTGAFDRFGSSVAISGGTVVVGAHLEDSSSTGVNGNGADNSATFAGAAYVFTRSVGVWSQQAYLKASNTGVNDQFGTSVAISGETIVVGAHGEDSSATGVDGEAADNSASWAGAAYVFIRSAGAWSQQAYAKAFNTGAGDEFGISVAISGDTIVGGARYEDSNGTGVNGDGADNWASSAGAAYVYGPSCVRPPFSDVPTSHPFCAEIEWMSQMGISTGFNDGTYRPSIDVTRQAMSAFLARFAGATLTDCTEPPFSDVPIDHPFCAEIKWMKDNAISTGFDDGTYRPALDVTRQAMSAFLARVAAATLSNCTSPPFSDVPTSHPFCKEIKWMEYAGISTGFDDGTYRPSIDVTRQAMSAFLYRLRVFLI